MQTTTINNIELVYPDTTAYLHDNLFVRVVGINGQAVGAKIQVTDLASGEQRKLSYVSEMSEVVFSLNDAFLSLWHDAVSFNIKMRLYENGV